jgi:triphosphoribosyl-dephospho-CoA synthetase
MHQQGKQQEIAREVLRNVILSQALEPLSSKVGLTTRHVDISPGTKLEYFIVATVNSAWPFYDLAEETLHQGRQPDCIYDAALSAQRMSMRNRRGSKVNLGQILLLIPLTTAHVLEHIDKGSDFTAASIISRARDVLQATGSADVASFGKTIALANRLSQEHHQRLGDYAKTAESPDFAGFSSVWDVTNAHREFYIAAEQADGYPRTADALALMSSELDRGILSASDRVYVDLLSDIPRLDARADIIVAAYYLLFTVHPTSMLLP